MLYNRKNKQNKNLYGKHNNKKKQNCVVKIPKKTVPIVNLWDEMGLIIRAPRRKEREKERDGERSYTQFCLHYLETYVPLKA